MRGVLIALLICAATASAAAAQPNYHSWKPWHRTQPRPVDPGTAFWGGVLGGAISSWLSRQQSERPDREQTESELEPWSKEWFGWCSKRYRSFNPETGQYLGFDGNYHFCGD